MTVPGPSIRTSNLITGNSEMADRVRAHDWAATPLHSIDDWSDTLVASVNLMLHSPFPAILSWGPEMVFLYNDAAIPTLAGKHPHALGALYKDVFHEAWDLVSADLEGCFYEGKTAVRDNIFIPILLNGKLEEHYWSYSLTPVYEDGRVAGIFDTYRNTTDIIAVAQKLQESEARLKIATEVAELGIFTWDLSADSALWENDRVFEILGHAPKDRQLAGARFLEEVVHPDHREAFKKSIQLTAESGAAFHFEGMISFPDKTHRTVEINGQLQSSQGGSRNRILATIRDITKNKENQQTARERTRRFSEIAAIVESSDDAILSKNLDGIITSWNAAAEQVFGYTADEMIGCSILKLIPKELHSDEQTIISNIKAGRRVEHFETVRLTKSGRPLDVSLTVSPVKDETGKVIGASKILRDISGRKRMEQSLLQAEKIAATGRMAATIAHEINNPLEAVMNLLYLLRPKISDVEGIDYLSSAETELGRVSHIAKQTLGYYREHASASSASIADIVSHAITIYEPRCTAVGITITKSLQSKRKTVLRRGEMMQIISNLIANSIYAMPGGGVLSLCVEDTTDSRDGIVLTVRDHGVGIPRDILPRVFDAFFTTRSTVGTGIGLFVAKQFVEGHGGQITIESSTDPETHGTTVEVFIPATTPYETADN